MTSVHLGRAALVRLPLVLFLGVVLTSSTVVPASNAGRSARSITADAVKPSACSALTLAGVTAGSGTFNDSAASNLVLGTRRSTRSGA